MHQYNTTYIYFLTLVAAFGGLLFGYDTGVIAGAVFAVQQEFGVAQTEATTVMEVFKSGWIVSCALIGAIIGVVSVGSLSDRFGRKRVMLVAAALLAISAIATYFPRNLTEFVIARILGGVGVGIASMLSPMYIAEIAPPHIRGRLVAINQLALISGMFATSVVNFTLQQQLGSAEAAWRWMFGAEAVPAIMFCILLLFIPESPRWLLQRKRTDRGRSILEKIGGVSYADKTIDEIHRAPSGTDTPKLSEFFAHPGLRMALIVGVVIAAVLQFAGINTVMYYTVSILQSGGASETEAFMKTMILNGVNLFCSVMAVLFIDKIGRKPLLLFAFGGMGLCLVGLGFAAGGEGNQQLSFILLLCYVACFMFGLGPGFWALVSEIYPTRFRGRALSLVTLSTWFSVFIISQTYPLLEKAVGTSWTYWIYGILAFVGFFFVLRFVFETKGKTLEEIEQMWLRGSSRKE